jgi:2-polyprenyl-6-methoxyphenol hydroxylase-like FAD-dependent oxidoreductase
MVMEERHKALVVGLGIAGMSAALRLDEAGWDVTVIERAPGRRQGGYMVGMFPPGLKAADRLGVNDDIVKRTQDGVTTLQVDKRGRKEKGLGFTDQPGSPELVLRGDIETGLWANVDGRVTVRFDTVPVAIEQIPGAAVVTLREGASETETRESFDLVVGADGMRSTVRRIAFGPHERYLKPLNAMICAFQMSGQLEGLAGHESAIIAEPNRALWIFTLDGTAPTALFTYRTKDIDAQFARDRVEVLREAYSDVSGGGLVEAALAELEKAPEALFDSVNMVQMPSWHEGRVVLVGDSAWCLTLYSGMGATAGMMGGTMLGDMIAKYPDDIDRALTAYEAELRPFVEENQGSIGIKSQFFVPSGRIAWWLRRTAMRAMVKGYIRPPIFKAEEEDVAARAA